MILKYTEFKFYFLNETAQNNPKGSLSSSEDDFLRCWCSFQGDLYNIWFSVYKTFQISLESLYAKFSTFSEDNLYSFAPDLTTHYFTLTQDWR